MACCVFEYGGVTPAAWNDCLAALCLVFVAFWLTGSAGRFAPPLGAPLLILLILMPACAALQLLPLPFPAMRALDPARADLATAVSKIVPHPTSIPISVAPSVTLAHLARILAYILVFFLVRELTWRFARRPWITAVPIVCIATVESALGLAQYFSGAAATGTYVNPDHFAGLLEMTLPFAVMPMLFNSRRRQPDRFSSMSWTLLVCLSLVCSASIFLGLLYSLSRMGLAAGLVALAILLGLSASRTGSPRRRIVVGAGIPAVLLLLVVFIVPGPLLDRLAGTHMGGGVTAEARVQFWKETWRLIAEHPLFGCGLGTYASAIQKYRASAPLGLLEFAHNDYLQLLAELGAVGFSVFFAAGALCLAQAFRASLDNPESRSRYLAIACAASLSAIALHGLVDFNFYIPANAMIAAWSAGIAGALSVTAPRRSRDLRAKAQADARSIPGIV